MKSDLIYFFHIPKTAGTSLSLAMKEVYGSNAVSPQLLWDDFLTGKFAISPETRVIIGHFGGLLPFYLGQMPRMMTLLRDPVARALSHINHVQRDPNHPLHELAQPLSIIDYCRDEKLRRTIDNFQTRYLASLAFAQALMTKPSQFGDSHHGHYSVAFENSLLAMDSQYDLQQSAMDALNAMDAFGICEDQEKSLEHFSQVFQWPAKARNLRANTSLDTQKKVSDLSFRERRWLQAVTTLDQGVYDWACSIFAQRYQQTTIQKPIRRAA
jgi:hypothetical protein